MNAAKRVQINVALQSVDTLEWVSNKVFECEFIWNSSCVDTLTSGKTRNQQVVLSDGKGRKAWFIFSREKSRTAKKNNLSQADHDQEPISWSMQLSY